MGRILPSAALRVQMPAEPNILICCCRRATQEPRALSRAPRHYGWSVSTADRFVATPVAVELIGAVVESSMPDLTRLRKGVWALPLAADTTGLLTVDHWKGGSFSIGYGVCCTWVPFSHRGGRKMQHPRTLKQSVPHLWVDHFTNDTPEPLYISQLHGVDRLQRQASAAVDEAGSTARRWWAATSTPDGVLAEARRQAVNHFDIHSPRARLVAAFTLARLGDLAAARVELDPILDSMTGSDDARAGQLATLLEHTAGPDHGDPPPSGR